MCSATTAHELDREITASSGGTCVAPRARMVRENTPRALIHDARFRSALEDCVQTCQAAAVTMIAVSVTAHARGQRTLLYDCWRACDAAAAALDRIDSLSREELVRAMRNCEARNGSLVSPASAIGGEPWSRCSKLARRCARACRVLARWIEQGSPPDCETTEAATVELRC
jgi:hypothetical protein